MTPQRLFLRGIGVAALMAMTLLITPDVRSQAGAGAQDCDCSCEGFAKFRSMTSGHSGTGLSPEMRAAAACYGQCMQAWMQCVRQPASGTAAKEEKQWDCDSRPNSPVERRQWREVCGAAAATDYWPSRLGEPRDDLGRFLGEYRNPDLGWIVAPAEASMEMQDGGRGPIPPGYLMVYATRGDVAPYYLKSVADTRYLYTNTRGERKVAEFEAGAEGRAKALILDGRRYMRVAPGRGR